MIKRLTTSDLSMIEKLLEEENRATLNPENIRSFLSDTSNYFLAFIDNEQILGYALAYTLARYDGRESMMYLHEIEVKESARRKGIGKKLLNEMNNICEQKGFMKLFLITNKSNKPAVALYESLSGEASNDDDIVYTFKS